PLLASLVSTNTLTSHQWSHVVLTMEGQRLTLYVNGIKDRSVLLGTNGVRQTGASPLYVGDVAAGASAPFEGYVDNLRVWNIALSATQVKAAMMGNYGGLSVSELMHGGLMAYFPVNEDDTDVVLHDLTGQYSASVTNGLLPDVGAVGMRDSVLYSAWHGYIHPAGGTCYNTNYYRYPTSSSPGAETYVFAVNSNTDLEVWWSEEVLLPDMLWPVYIPNWVERYRNLWPDPGECPHIVLASGQGSRQGGIFNEGYCLSLTNSGDVAHALLRKDAYFTGNFSLGVWVWINSLPASGHEATIFAVHNTTVSTNYLDAVSLSVTSTGAVKLLTQNGASTNVLTGSLATGRWVYVMATVQSGGAYLYLDNQHTNFSALMPVPQEITRTNCYIGYNGADPARLNGRVDELRIWNTVLLDSERAAAMYNDEERMNTDNLIAYFPFDPFHGRLIEDRVSGQRALLMNAGLESPGAPALGSRLYAIDQSAQVYVQNDAALPGYNPNEEQAILSREGGYDVAYALRDDLNTPFAQSQPFVLVDYLDADTGKPKMDVLLVVRTNEVYRTFSDATDAGLALNGPHPLDLLPGHWTGADIKETGAAWKARNKAWFALAGGLTPTSTSLVIMHNYYPMQSSFWFPGLSAAQQPAVGTPIPWLPTLSSAQVYQSTTYPTSGMPIAVDWTISWPSGIPTMDAGETLLRARGGLPDIWGQLSVEVVFQQSTDEDTHQENASVELYDPVCPQGVTLTNSLDDFGFDLGGSSPSIYLRNGLYYFHHLPPDLSGRLYYNPTLTRSNLVFTGSYVDPVAGDDYVMMNKLSPAQRAVLLSLVDDSNAHYADWARAIGLLAADRVELGPNQPFAGIALHAPGKGAGYVALAFNNATNPVMGVSSSLPVSLSLLRVTTNLAVGSIIPMEDDYNLLSEQMTMQYTLDFAGDPGAYIFDWRWSEPNPNGTTPEYPEACEVFTNGAGINSLILDGASPQDLLNRFFAVRYRAISNTVENVVGTNWS
ncbi:MAG: LamG domain-containing protein, partial [Lentisphaerota bacterium]